MWILPGIKLAFLSQHDQLQHAYSSSYNYLMVVASVLIAIFASFCAFEMVGRLSNGKHGRAWIGLAAVMLGVGIWSMHFIGMIAFRIDCGVTYEPWMTGLSMLPGIAAAAVALNVIAHEKVSRAKLVFSGVIMGAGVGLMHYSGMAAIRLDGILRYDLKLFLVSLVAAIMLAIPALGMKFIIANFRFSRRPYVPSLLGGTVLGVAISSMHYIAMDAAFFIHVGAAETIEAITPTMLALVVGVAVVLLLIFGFLFMLFSSRIANARSRIESILDTTSQGYIMIDADGIIVDCNPAMLAMLGLQEQSIVGQHVRKFVDDAEAKMHGNYQIDLNLRRADGSQIQSLVNGSTVLDTSQGKQFSFALFSDITERKHAEESLRASEERNRAITQSAFDAIVTSDNTGNIVGWNNGAEVIFGYPELEAMGQPLILLIPERYREGHLTGMHRFNSGGESHVIGKTVELNGLRKDGSEFPLELTLAKWESTDGWFITAIIGDITERKQMEKQLLQSEKLASIGQLAAGVAHEINNPIGFVNSNLGTLKHYVDDLLAVISAYESVETDSGSSTDLFAAVNALKTELDLAYVKEDVSSLLAESSDGLDRVKRIVQGLKDFSHIDAIETWKIDDIQQGIESTLNVVWNELKYKCEVRKEYGELPPVECMLANLNQVFMNLLVNAAHAIEDHGIVTIRTGRKDDEVWVEIADTGKGIPSGNLLHIFDPFFTTKPVGQGTGLGLSVSYGIVAKHHGRIEVDSEVGKGSTFRVWLPIRQPTKGKDTQTTVSSS